PARSPGGRLRVRAELDRRLRTHLWRVPPPAVRGTTRQGRQKRAETLPVGLDARRVSWSTLREPPGLPSAEARALARGCRGRESRAPVLPRHSGPRGGLRL